MIKTFLEHAVKMPLAGVAQFVKSKFRLFVEYLLIAAVITLCGATLTMWLEKAATEKKLVAVQKRLASTELVNFRQESHIKELKSLRVQDGRAFAMLLNNYRGLAKRDVEARNRLRKLEKNNATVQAYLDTPIPVELCRLYDSCPPSPDGTR